MKMLAVRCLVALSLLAAAAVAFANPFKSKIISSDDSVLEITVPGDHFMKIQNFPETGNRVWIAGPAIVRVRPIVGAKLFISYKKDRDEGSGGGGGGGGTPSPIPIFSPTPGATPTPTSNPFISPTPIG